MPVSLRIPPVKDEMLRKAAAKSRKTKTVPIFLRAVDEKLGLVRNREQVVSELAGWLSHEEAQEVRNAVEIFNKVDEEKWD